MDTVLAEREVGERDGEGEGGIEGEGVEREYKDRSDVGEYR